MGPIVRTLSLSPSSLRIMLWSISVRTCSVVSPNLVVLFMLILSSQSGCSDYLGLGCRHGFKIYYLIILTKLTGSRVRGVITQMPSSLTYYLLMRLLKGSCQFHVSSMRSYYLSCSMLQFGLMLKMGPISYKNYCYLVSVALVELSIDQLLLMMLILSQLITSKSLCMYHRMLLSPRQVWICYRWGMVVVSVLNLMKKWMRLLQNQLILESIMMDCSDTFRCTTIYVLLLFSQAMTYFVPQSLIYFARQVSNRCALVSMRAWMYLGLQRRFLDSYLGSSQKKWCLWVAKIYSITASIVFSSGYKLESHQQQYFSATLPMLMPCSLSLLRHDSDSKTYLPCLSTVFTQIFVLISCTSSDASSMSLSEYPKYFSFCGTISISTCLLLPISLILSLQCYFKIMDISIRPSSSTQVHLLVSSLRYYSLAKGPLMLSPSSQESDSEQTMTSQSSLAWGANLLTKFLYWSSVSNSIVSWILGIYFSALQSTDYSTYKSIDLSSVSYMPSKFNRLAKLTNRL